MQPDDVRNPYVAGLAVVALATLLYSLFVLRAPLLWLAGASTVLLVVLAWRAVGALGALSGARGNG